MRNEIDGIRSNKALHGGLDIKYVAKFQPQQ